MKADSTEKGLETLIMRHASGTDGLASGGAGVVANAALVSLLEETIT